MQKVLYLNQIKEIANEIDQELVDYINEGQIQTFESFKNFDFIAFDWYDIHKIAPVPSQIMIYIDKEDIFFLCESDASYQKVCSIFKLEESNEDLLYNFFSNLIKGDNQYLEEIEEELSHLEEEIINGNKHSCIEEMLDTRKELLQFKKYYEQLIMIFEDMLANNNQLFSTESLRSLTILNSRIARVLSNVLNLREYVTQIREAYQSQIDIEQNQLMKVFTVVTSIFLPLTLIAGWYGMNFNMPEFAWRYGYPMVIGLSVITCIVWYFFTKWKKWF